MLNYLLKKLTG